MMLDQPRPLAVSTDCVETPKRAAIALIVSPATIVYLPDETGASCGADCTGPLVVSFSSWPGKMSDDQPSPLRASTDAVESPKRVAMPLTVSPATTWYVAGACGGDGGRLRAR